MRTLSFLLLSSLIAGCATGADGETTLVKVVDEPAGSACEFGGVKLQTGLDLDRDGALSVPEVQETRYICDGRIAEAGTVVRTAEEDAGENCANGGVRIETGADQNNDGALGDLEVEETFYSCNGTDGADGADGADGVDGTNGVNGTDGFDGTNGDDGVSYLVDTQGEPAGGNCTEGGVKIDSGPDTNGNGVLDFSEVTSTDYVCDGSGGGGGGAIAEVSYGEPVVVSNQTDVTLISTSITVPGPGTVLAFGSTDAYCSPDAGTNYTCASGSIPTRGYLSVTAAAMDPAAGPGHSYFFLAPDVTENVGRTSSFDITNSGTFTFYLRARSEAAPIGFWRRGLTLVYLPD